MRSLFNLEVSFLSFNCPRQCAQLVQIDPLWSCQYIPVSFCTGTLIIIQNLNLRVCLTAIILNIARVEALQKRSQIGAKIKVGKRSIRA
jgi:hypothetical protein